MSISQTNIPTAVQVTVTIDGTAFQDQTTAINPSGGEYGVNSMSVLNLSLIHISDTNRPAGLPAAGLRPERRTGQWQGGDNGFRRPTD